ncbi:hypothetical protein Tco_1255083 [Tanacetum coccineum]
MFCFPGCSLLRLIEASGRWLWRWAEVSLLSFCGRKCSRVADAPVYTATDIVTSSQGKTLVVPTLDVGGSSQPEASEESADSFYETAV